MDKLGRPHVIITGGASGIGLALAKLFAKDGCHLSLYGRHRAKLLKAQEVVKDHMTNEQECLIYAVDVREAEELKEAIEESITILGCPKILITSAGVAVADYFERIDPKVFHDMMDINYFGTLNAIQSVLPFMKEAGQGHLVLIASAAAFTGMFGYTAYGPSKFAVRGLAESLRTELKPLNIHVTVAYPPDTDTPQLTEENRTKPEETKKFSQGAGILSPDDVAFSIKEALLKKKFIAAPNFITTFLNTFHSLLNPLLRAYQDMITKDVKKKTIQNWGLTVAFSPEKIFYPQTLEELKELVLTAKKEKKKIRPVGSLYSYTPLVVTDTYLVSLDNYAGLSEINKQTLEATVKAGTKLEVLEKLLFQEGLGLKSLGDINQQSLGGFISTGCHGTGKDNQGFSTSITWLKILKADGSYIECSPEINPELFKAAQISLGTFGIITDVRLKVIPKFNVEITKFRKSFDQCLEQLDDSLHQNDCYEFFWFPYTDDVLEKKINFTDKTPSSLLLLKKFNDYFLENYALWLICEVSAKFPKMYREKARKIIPYFLTKSQNVVPCEGCYATPRLVKHFEIEYAIPYPNGKKTLIALKKLLEEDPTHVSFPVEVRYTKADDLYLSPCYKQDCLWIAVHAYVKDDYIDLFKKCEALFIANQGRPHWGKLHWRTGKDFAKMYDHWDLFKRFRQELDPDKIFLNPYLEKLLEDAPEKT